jgi:signal transduction histidine kinase/ligand-binding sensor domain-containing protein/DNA-binding response OmpR family regulator
LICFPLSRYIFCCFIILFSSINIVSAADYKVELLNIDHGFDSSVIFSIVQDEQGFLWFGSGYQGLFRYDGKNIRRYKHDTKNLNSLPHNNTGNLTIDNKNNLWIGSFGGSVIKYDLSSASFFQYPHNPLQSSTVSDSSVQKIFQDSQGDYWMGTFQHGLNKFNAKNNTFTRFPFDVDTGNGTSHERIWDIAETAKNNLWLATSYGLNHLDKSTGKFSYFIPDPGKLLRSSNKIRKILVIDTNRLLLTTDVGVLIFNVIQQTFTPIKELTNKNIGEGYSAIKTSFGQYWIASSSGLYAFSLDTLILKKIDLGFNDDCSHTLFEDREGLIWLTCEGVGVYKITPKNDFKIKNAPYFRSVRDITVASDNSIYLISPSYGIREWFPKTNRLTSPFPNTEDLEPDRLFRSKEGEKWIKGSKKIYSINEAGNIVPIKIPQKLQSLALENDTFSFYGFQIDKNSRLWMGTKKGLFIIDKQNNDFLYFGNGSNSSIEAFTNQDINNIYRDHDDRMWVATPNALYLWNEISESFQRFDFAIDEDLNFSQEHFIYCVYQDKEKRIWLGSQKGLYILNSQTGKISPSPVNNDLGNKNIIAITNDDNGNLWLLTDVGISMFNPSTSNFQNFDQRDGLSDSRPYNQLSKTSDGTIYFASREGLHYFNPESFNEQIHTANTVLTNFEILGSLTSEKRYTPNTVEFDLAYDENYFKFEFITLDISNGKHLNYHYKLEGLDNKWINNGNSNTAVYTNLDGGSYTFRVRTTYRKNEWYDQELAIKVNIATPFWLTWWMYVIYLCSVLLLIQQFMKRKAITQQKIIDQQNHFVVELEQQVAEKTASIAKESNKLLQANKIKSQFLANMSHEIRTPLNAIIGLSDIALQHESNAMQADKLHKIQDSSETLLYLINDILDLSKIEAEKLVLEHLPFNLGDLIKKTINICSYKAYEKDLELIIDIADDVEKELVGDQLRLQQILLNLVNNSVKFTDKGIIYINVENVSNNTKQTNLQFSITDTGIGMNLKDHTSLFQAFSQADNSITKKYGGTGLGLAISKQLIELMHGEISVRSELAKGSVFTFNAKFDLIAQDSSEKINTQSVIDHELKMLIVDSNEIVRNILIRELNQNNIFPDDASSAQEAIELIVTSKRDNAPYHLALIDRNLLKKETCSVTLEIKDHLMTSLPYILMNTTFDMDTSSSLTSSSNFKGFIEKPIISSTFIESLANLLAPIKTQNYIDSREKEVKKIPELKGYSVLLVEDNLLNQQVAKAFLEDTNIQIDYAENGILAINKIKQKNYDIILMDIQMPEMDGLTATSVIKNDLKMTELPIIAMTAHAMEGDIQKSLQIGMNAHLTKPISQDILYEILLEHLQPVDDLK